MQNNNYIYETAIALKNIMFEVNETGDLGELYTFLDSLGIKVKQINYILDLFDGIGQQGYSHMGLRMDTDG